jgi:hypothetical protein
MAKAACQRTGVQRGRSLRLKAMVQPGGNFDYGTEDDDPVGDEEGAKPTCR